MGEAESLRYPPELVSQLGQVVHVAGEPVGARIERNADERHIDHLNVNVRVARYGVIEVTLNTRSLRNLNAGFDARVRLATIVANWATLPSSGVFPSSGFDYALLEKAGGIAYAMHEQNALEQLLIIKAKSAEFIEAWGELYLQPRIGIHQVHSRRASPAFPIDHVGRDGAIRFFFAKPKHSELLLLKFFGQP